MATLVDQAIFINFTQPLEKVGGIQWIIDNPVTAWPYLILCAVMTVFGTTGNMACIGSILLNKTLRHSRNAFLLNMAVADLVVTGIGDPLSILGMVLGKEFFTSQAGLCEVVSTLCMAACISALFSLGAVSFHQCITICYPDISLKLFNLRSHLLMIGCFWVIGCLISLPPLVGWSEITFDEKYLECFFNRLHSESYTSFYAGIVIATPLCIISVSYIKIYKHVLASKKRIAALGKEKNAGNNQSLRLAKTLVGIFLVFVVCWGPFAILIVVDREDRGHIALHLYILLLAHMHASLNPLVYLLTNKHYRHGFRLFFSMLFPCCNIRLSPGGSMTGPGSSVTAKTVVTSIATLGA